MKLSFACCGIECCPNKSHMLDARVPQDEIGELYDGKAWFYDFWAFLTESKARDRALELAEIHDGQSILEVAVGTGLMFNEIVKRNSHGQNVGIDISEGMLSRAETRLAKQNSEIYSLSIGSAFDLKVGDASVDMLVNNYMFDLVPFNQMDKIIGETSIKHQFNAMINIIGEYGATQKVLETENAHLHLYDKEERQDRKLGHITITSNSFDALNKSIDSLKEYLP